MGYFKYRFLEEIRDPISGEYTHEDESPKKKDTGEFGERLLHRIAKIKVRYELVEGKKVRVESISSLGGWIESYMNLSQSGDCWVGSNAIVCGGAMVSGDAQVTGNAVVGEGARITEKATVSGRSIVGGMSIIYGNGSVSGEERLAVSGSAVVSGSVSRNASVTGSAKIKGEVSINAKVGGRAIVYGKVSKNAVVSDNATIHGEVTDNAYVYGNTIVLSGGKVKGSAHVDGGVIDGTIEGTASFGTGFTTFGVVQENENLLPSEANLRYLNYLDIDEKKRPREFYLPFYEESTSKMSSAIELVSELGILYQTGRLGLYSMVPNEIGQKWLIEIFKAKGWIEDKRDEEEKLKKKYPIYKEGEAYIVYGKNRIPVNIQPYEDYQLDYLSRVIHNYTTSASVGYPCPIMLGGKLSGGAMVAGATIFDGKIKGNLILIAGPMQFRGVINNGSKMIIGGTGVFTGTCTGNSISAYNSIIEGTLKGSPISERAVKKEIVSLKIDGVFLEGSGRIVGESDIQESIIGGVINGINSYEDNKITMGGVTGNGSIIRKGENISPNSIPKRKYPNPLMQNPKVAGSKIPSAFDRMDLAQWDLIYKELEEFVLGETYLTEYWKMQVEAADKEYKRNEESAERKKRWDKYKQSEAYAKAQEAKRKAKEEREKKR